MLMNVLEAFVNDPLPDFRNQIQKSVGVDMLHTWGWALNQSPITQKVPVPGQTMRSYLLTPVELKLNGYFRAKILVPGPGKQMNIPTHVQNLIQSATDITNFVRGSFRITYTKLRSIVF